MNIEDDNKVILFLKKLRPLKYIPRESFYLFITLKLFPLFLLTHDWNIVNSPNRGLSSYLFEFTLGPLIHKQKSNTLNIILLVFLFLFCLYSSLVLLTHSRQQFFIYFITCYCIIQSFINKLSVLEM